MSLYTFNRQNNLPQLKQVSGLHIEECTDITLLSLMGNISEKEVVSRLANDNLAFVAWVHGQAAAFGWMARGKARIGELNHSFILPLRNRYLWNFRTMPAFRGFGIYPLLLQYIIRHEAHKAEDFWIIHAPENSASLRGIQKAGFRYTGKLYVTTDGLAGFEPYSVSGAERELIETMDFHFSPETSPACWNCSSPYLKNRLEACCCEEGSGGCSTYRAKTA